jgi:hypothetical protein
MLKMESIIEKEFDGETPEVWVWSEAKSTQRSQGYIERIPFVKWGGYFDAKAHHSYGSQVFVRGNPLMVRDWEGFDMFVAFNAPLGQGHRLATIVPKWKINWDYEIKLTEEDESFGKGMRAQGEYIPVWFCGHSFYKGWLDKFTTGKMHDLIDKLGEHGHVILTGAKWDIPFMRQFKCAGVSDLVGMTSMGSLLGLLKHAKAYVGHAAGQGMLAQHMGTKTFLLWHPRQWVPDFMTNWVEPKKNDTVYHALDIRHPCTPYILENL